MNKSNNLLEKSKTTVKQVDLFDINVHGLIEINELEFLSSIKLEECTEN